MTLFKFKIVVIGLRSESNLFDDNFGSLRFDYLLSFLLFVKKLLVVNNLTNRRNSVGEISTRSSSCSLASSNALFSINSNFNVIAD
jgi:hypothetical protein